MNRRSRWTPEMDAILRAEYETTPVEDIKRSAGWDINVKTITSRARKLGLRRITPTKHGAFWTEERDQQLRELYPHMPTRDLIIRLKWDCRPSYVHQRAHLLGICKKPAEIRPSVLDVKEHQGYRVLTHRMGG